ncbi:MAG: EamA family transporter [Candidatus Thermoplasmatota archaeon]|nr:EamA family transporter [Candidatus Thermoplasmatota archaeon]
MEGKNSAILATLLSSVIWGSSFVAIGWGLGAGGLDPYSFAFIRFLVAALAMFVPLALLTKFNFSLFADRQIIIIGLVNGLAYFLQFIAQDYTTPAKAALLVNLNNILVAFLSVWMFGEKLGISKKAAIILGVVGVFLVTTKGDISVLRTGGGTELIGDALALVAGIAWAFYIVLMKKYVSSGERNISQLTACVFVYTAIAILPAFLISGGLSAVPLISTNGWIAIIYTAIFCTIAAFVLWSYGLRKISATASSVMLLMEIVSAFFLSIALGLEGTFVPLEASGVVFVVGAVALASFDLSKK